MAMDQFSQLIETHPHLFIKQIKEWVEIFTNFETRNKYELLGSNGTRLAYVLERSGGFKRTLTRFFLGSHRPFEIDVVTGEQQAPLLTLQRDFFWFFSSLRVQCSSGQLLGTIERRFAILSKRYDLKDSSGRVFAIIKSPIWHIWTFTIYDTNDKERAVITKKWQGMIKEAFTDADMFMINFNQHSWTVEQKALLVATAVSIDFDFFENNQKQG